MLDRLRIRVKIVRKGLNMLQIVRWRLMKRVRRLVCGLGLQRVKGG